MFTPPKVPKKLARDTIFEAVFEVRFTQRRAEVAAMLPGFLFSKLPGLFSSTQELPFAQMPAEIRDANELFTYQATHALIGENNRLLVGPRSLTVAVTRPYPGWIGFSRLIAKCVHALLDTSFVQDFERCSLKYTNLLSEGSDEKDLTQLKVSFDLAGLPLTGIGTQLKAEVLHRDCVSLVNVITAARLKLSTDATDAIGHSGLLVTVDTIKLGPLANFASDFSKVLGILHMAEKEVFFSLLTPETLQKLGPEW